MVGSAKVLLGAIAVAGTSVLALGAHALVRDKTIEEKLKRENYQFLSTSNTEDDSEWTKLVNKYSSSSEKIPDLQTLNSDQKQNLKQKCEELKKTMISVDKDESKIKAVKRWCTKQSPELKEDAKNLRQSTAEKDNLKTPQVEIK